MNVRNLLTINALYAGLVALAAIFVPQTLLTINGLNISQSTLNLQRFVGASIAGYAIASWLMRNAGPSAARRAFLIGGGLGYVLVAIVIVVNIIALFEVGDFVMGWIYLLISLVFAAAFLYLGLREPGGE